MTYKAKSEAEIKCEPLKPAQKSQTRPDNADSIIYNNRPIRQDKGSKHTLVSDEEQLHTYTHTDRLNFQSSIRLVRHALIPICNIPPGSPDEPDRIRSYEPNLGNRVIKSSKPSNNGSMKVVRPEPTTTN